MLLQMALFCSFYGWVIFHCIYVPPLLYPFIYQWILRLLPCLGYCNSAAMNIGVHVSFQIRVFCRYMPGSGIAGSYGNSIFPASWETEPDLSSWAVSEYLTHGNCEKINVVLRQKKKLWSIQKIQWEVPVISTLTLNAIWKKTAGNFIFKNLTKLWNIFQEKYQCHGI